MVNYNWNFGILLKYDQILIQAFAVTFQLIVYTIVLAVLLGLVLSFFRMSKIRLVRYLAALLIEVHRATPPLVLLVWYYYCAPILVGVKMTAFETGFIALGIYTAAFYAEIFRAGLQSIERGQFEAAEAVGMTAPQTFSRITGPQAFLRIFPPFISQCSLVIKNTVLTSSIAVGELLYAGQRISIETFRPLEVLTTVALVFICMILPMTLMANELERRLRQRYGL